MARLFLLELWFEKVLHFASKYEAIVLVTYDLRLHIVDTPQVLMDLPFFDSTQKLEVVIIDLHIELGKHKNVTTFYNKASSKYLRFIELVFVSLAGLEINQFERICVLSQAIQDSIVD